MKHYQKITLITLTSLLGYQTHSQIDAEDAKYMAEIPTANQTGVSSVEGDFNNDGFLDMILAGNFFGSRIRFGRYDANKGVVLLGDGHGHFMDVPNNQSGLLINGEVRDITRVKLSSGLEMLLFSTNNDSLQIYQKSKLQDL